MRTTKSSDKMIDMVQIPVKMGSHRMLIDLPVNKTQLFDEQQLPTQADNKCKLTCRQFIDIVLKKCKLQGSEQLIKTYSIFESVNGIERMLKSSDSVMDIWMNWSKLYPKVFKLNQTQEDHSVCVELVVRKHRQLEKKVRMDDKQSKMIKKCYKKIKQASLQPAVYENELEVIDVQKVKREHQLKPEYHVYEQMDSTAENSEAHKEMLKKILKNEMELRKQAKKLIKVEQNIHKHVVELENNLMKKLSASKEALVAQVEPKSESATQTYEELRQLPTAKPKQEPVCNFHKSQLQNNLNYKLAENINFLQFLHFKLKKENVLNKSKCDSVKKFFDSNKSMFGFSKLENNCDSLNSCGNSAYNSDDNSSNCNSRFTSTSTLESLV